MRNVRFALIVITGLAIAGLVVALSESALATGKKRIRCRLANANCDFDSDGLLNGRERRLRIYNVRRKDSDRDGMPDGDEDRNRNGIANEDEDDERCRDLDQDNDGLADEDENDFGTDPRDSDSDDDGIVDGNDDSNANGISDEDEDDAGGGIDDGDDEDDEDDEDDSDGDDDDDSEEPESARGNSCSREDFDDSAGPIPTPAPTGAPQPTATPSSPSGNTCDSQRRTTGFGIPAGFTGNGQLGASLWSASCASCHGANGKRNTSYSRMYSSRNVGSMAAVKALLSSIQNSANLTADRNCP